ncbi:hypothetical protein FKW77_007579 [Venturia effusa]|uniref:CorA-like transporter domain-containing protein n=1 Tax=Venturia effusa TaxID=50376 RepID=A0A517KWU5_9PEZI|nr:hypothetical protein FKW77_007579 [Venturia effusa]
MQDGDWRKYPQSLSAVCVNQRLVDQRFEDVDNDLFEEDEINVRVTDVLDQVLTTTLYDDGDKLWKAIRQRSKPGRHVDPNFLRIVFSFGEEPHLAESSSSFLSVRTDKESSKTEISYQLNYVEENRRGGYDPWSFRHTGVYHRHTSNSDLFILLHPTQDSIFEDHLLSMLGINLIEISTEPIASAALADDPYRLHSLVLASFLDNWRWYFRYLGDHFASENSKAMVLRPEQTKSDSSFQRVKNLRNINDFAQFAKGCCTSGLELVEGMRDSGIDSLESCQHLSSHITTLKGYVKSSEGLIDRVRNTIDLVGYTLTLHNQLETAKVDNELRDLTKRLKTLTESTVNDSTTVRIITFVSAFYLPGSFAASVYGMNFFGFDTKTRQITIGNDFWIFIATWLPLTLMTVAVYLFVLFLNRRKKTRKQFEWPWRQAAAIQVASDEKLVLESS